MGAECGVTCSIFPSDSVTRQFLKAQGREKSWVELSADEGANYERVVEIDLSKLEPLAACPHSPGNIKTVRELAGLEVQQVCVGSCTNSSYRDLMVVAKALEGKRVAPGVSFVVAPGSRQVLQMIAKNGALNTFLNAGARIAESACGFCIGNSQSPQTEAVSIRTSNRNFLGRSGTKTANVYLVSPETAAAAALKGKLADPRKLGDYPKIAQPKQFLIDDSMILAPSRTPAKVTLYRGPNIGSPPVNDPMPAMIAGVVTMKVGDNTTTDHIIPAGARMKYRSNVPKYSEFVFEVLDPKFHERAKAVQAKGQHSIIVGGLSYGQGSSREHAAICPMFLGVKAVLAKGFERIHTANLINFGILPLTFANEADYDKIDQGDELEIPDARQAVAKSKAEEGAVVCRNKTKGTTFKANYKLSGRQRDILLAGGTLSYMKSQA
jgi:aconitate hydratase